MGAPRDLREVDSSEIMAELNRRIDDRENGLCDYCHHAVGQPVAHLDGGERELTPHCQKPNRHNGAQDEREWSITLELPTDPFSAVD